MVSNTHQALWQGRYCPLPAAIQAEDIEHFRRWHCGLTEGFRLDARGFVPEISHAKYGNYDYDVWRHSTIADQRTAYLPQKGYIVQGLSNHLFTLLRILIAVAMLWYLASMGSIDWSSFAGLASAWHFSILGLLLFFISTVLQALRLQLLINAHKLTLPFNAAFKLTFIGLFFSTYLPGATGGDLVKIYYASKGNPGSRTEVITILLLDRFIGLFALLTLPLFLAPFFSDLIASQTTLQALLAVSGAIAVGIMLVTIIGARIELADSRLLHWLEQRSHLGKQIARILRTIHYYRNAVPTLIAVIGVAYLSQLLMVGVALAVAEAISPMGADLTMLVLVPIGYMANSMPITPGGLGVGEAALEGLFTMCGLSGGAETLIGWRIAMIVVGLVGLVYYLKGEKRFVYSTSNNIKQTDSQLSDG